MRGESDLTSNVGEMKRRDNNHSCPTHAASDSAADSSMLVDEAADALSRPEAADEETEGVELSSSTQQTAAVPPAHSEPSEPASSSSPARQPSTEDEDGEACAERTV